MDASSADRESLIHNTTDMPNVNSATIESVAEEVIELVQDEVGSVDLTVDSSLQSQGLDSLRIMSLIFKIEARYDIFFEAEDADDLRTVGDLAAIVVRRIGEQP
jgi:acyl carrier protein